DFAVFFLSPFGLRKKTALFSGSMVNQKKNKNFAPEPKSLLDLGSGANFFLPMVNQKRLRLRGVEGPLYRHASEGIPSSLSLAPALLLSVPLSPPLCPPLSSLLSLILSPTRGALSPSHPRVNHSECRWRRETP